MIKNDNSLLLVTHVGLRQGEHGLLIDDQTAASVRQWCNHFARVTYCGLTVDQSSVFDNAAAWHDTKKGVLGEQVRFIALPAAYKPIDMAKSWRQVRATLAQQVNAHQHLCFTLGNVVGDWPALGACEAIRQSRRYSAWVDRVEPHVIRTQWSWRSPRRLAAELAMPFTQFAIRYLLGRSTIALLQGRDTYDWYAKSASDPHCTYDTHTTLADQIDLATLTAKKTRATSGAPLRIVYVGRAVPMKGPHQWLEILAKLQAKGIPFSAKWLGDGPELASMRLSVARLGLDGSVCLAGAVSRETVLENLRDSDILLFCHQTSESARCLIEALVSGCPIVGFDSAYPRDLVEGTGGGLFAPRKHIDAVTALIAGLANNRDTLAKLIAGAAHAGERFDEVSLYAHRAALMKKA